jgi:SAM-dependent methyltransferase
VSADRHVSRRPSYALHCRDHTPNALVVEAVSLLGGFAGGRALDIGAGSLSSSRHLLSAGFIVDAVDPDPHAAELAAALGNPRLLLQCADIRDVELAERSYNIIVATHVLHLIPRADLHRLMAKIAGWLIDGAIFCATFLGTRDSWAPTPWRATVLGPRTGVRSRGDPPGRARVRGHQRARGAKALAHAALPLAEFGALTAGAFTILLNLFPSRDQVSRPVISN